MIKFLLKNKNMCDRDDCEITYNKYLNCAWHYAACYTNYSNELEKYNKIRSDKINEYKKKYIDMLYSENTAIKLAYGRVNKSITLKNQYKHLEYAQNKLKNIDNTYNTLYNKIFLD